MGCTRARLRDRRRLQKKYPVVRNLPRYEVVGTGGLEVQTIQAVLVNTDTATVAFDTPFPVPPTVTANVVYRVDDYGDGLPPPAAGFDINPGNVNVYISSVTATDVTIRTSVPITATVMVQAIHIEGTPECTLPSAPVVITEPAELLAILTPDSFIIDATQDSLEGNTVPYMRSNPTKQAMTVLSGSLVLGNNSVVGGKAWSSAGGGYATAGENNPLGLDTSLNASDFSVVVMTTGGDGNILDNGFGTAAPYAEGISVKISTFGGPPVEFPFPPAAAVILGRGSGASEVVGTGYLKNNDPFQGWLTTDLVNAYRFEFDTGTGTMSVYVDGAHVPANDDVNPTLTYADMRGIYPLEFLRITLDPLHPLNIFNGSVGFIGVWPTRLSEDATLKADVETYLSSVFTAFGGTV